MRLIPIECVKPNTVIGKTLYDSDGRVLVRAGMVLSERIIFKIKDLKYFINIYN